MDICLFIKSDDGEKLSKQKIVRFKSPLHNDIMLVTSTEGNRTWEKWCLFKYSVTIRTNCLPVWNRCGWCTNGIVLSLWVPQYQINQSKQEICFSQDFVPRRHLAMRNPIPALASCLLNPTLFPQKMANQMTGARWYLGIIGCWAEIYGDRIFY